MIITSTIPLLCPGRAAKRCRLARLCADGVCRRCTGPTLWDTPEDAAAIAAAGGLSP